MPGSRHDPYKRVIRDKLQRDAVAGRLWTGMTQLRQVRGHGSADQSTRSLPPMITTVDRIEAGRAPLDVAAHPSGWNVAIAYSGR